MKAWIPLLRRMESQNKAGSKGCVNGAHGEEGSIPIEDGYGFVGHMAPSSKKHANRKQRKQEALQDRYEMYKPLVPHPDIFEVEDATCEDPVFYNLMKGMQGSVPVPGTWKSNRIFPRGYNKPRYSIPLNVERTGIPALRRALREHEAKLSLRERIKEKLYPRLGKSSVDQKALHDCFFTSQPKLKLLGYGEIFYPGWNYEIRRCEPGVMSVELMEALGIDDRTPPPWLFNMQKYGMPPSYPNARIPGLNAPIPEGCQYGYQPRGWGEPIIVQKAEDVKEEEHKAPNRYTNFIYVEEPEERVEVEEEKADVREEIPDDIRGPPTKDEEERKKRRAKKEKLLKSVRF
jgi:splicing factor 3B subunit 2